MLEFEATHVHSTLSNGLLGWPDSPAQVKDYARVYAERGQKCLIMTEHGNRGDCFLQLNEASNYDGMKAICGAEAYFVPDRLVKEPNEKPYHLILLAKNRTGFEELNEIFSEANISGFYGKARIDWELLRRLTPDNFIVSTACVAGILRDRNCEEMANTMANLFKGNFYLEVQPHVNDKQREFNEKVIELHKRYKWPLILGTDTHYVNKEDKYLREELMLSKKMQMPDDGQWDLYLPTAEECYKMFLDQNVLTRGQIEEAFENTLQCRDWDGFTCSKDRKFPISHLEMNEAERAKRYENLIFKGYIDKFGMPTDEEKKELRAEMNVVLETNSYDYFVTLYDIMEAGKRKGGVLTKTSRGSAASFATSAALNFTSMNRLHERVKLYPERFVSKEKLKNAMADLDSNISNLKAFEDGGKEIMGEHGFYPMIAFGKEQNLSAFKLLCRARNIEPATANIVSKQIKEYMLDKKHALENHADDDDYDVDEDVNISDYVEPQYHQLIEDSKEYMGIVSSISPHPCAHLCYHKDLRREIGLISLKPKAGESERRLTCFIEGATADDFGYCKLDLLQVDVVGVINDAFKAIGMETPEIDQLKEWVNTHPEVWKLYEKGYTMSINQLEREATRQKTMRFKPKNEVELAALVAGVRPGFKSLIQDFCDRRPHKYGIPALDKLLKMNYATGNTGESSYFMYDEHVLLLAQKAGIDPGDGVLLQKAIKKKKKEKVLHYKEAFIPGFTKYLIEEEHDDPVHAEQTSHDVWKIIEDGASYMFNSAHALAMAYDGLYEAMLKTIAPYEFYKTILKLYTDKGQIDKISQTSEEMKQYIGAKFDVCKFGLDNSDWRIDKEKKRIYQCLSSIKFMNDSLARALGQLPEEVMNMEKFIDVIDWLKNNTKINRRQLEILVRLNYFDRFGGNDKLLSLIFEYFDGKNKCASNPKSKPNRMVALRMLESANDNHDINVHECLLAEQKYIGILFSKSESYKGKYFVTSIDDKYGVKLIAYNCASGKYTPTLRIKKPDYDKNPFEIGDLLEINGNDTTAKTKYRYVNGMKYATDEQEWWISKWKITKAPDIEKRKDKGENE